MKVVYILPVSSGAMPQYTAELANAVSKYADYSCFLNTQGRDVLETMVLIL